MKAETRTNEDRSLVKTLTVVLLAAGFASAMAIASAFAGPSHDEAAPMGDSPHTCPHSKAAADADGAAAAPCDHAADGSCSKCAGEKDCSHAKGEGCSDCADKDAAPDQH